jgi:hypothetical protein
MFATVGAAELVEFVDGEGQEAGSEWRACLSMIAIGADNGPFVLWVLKK